MAETNNGRIPLWFAAAEGNLNVVTFLIQQKHDSYALLEDRKVWYKGDPREVISFIV